ncbi:putative E3 ubiquitin-protein ligase UBR7 [Bombina bombina]|uniref:putative E3 ubiquitin-protein ligase UBR7 n=1 Tax=Bombina bombina TaxID=8345 RepID=UPI00235B2A9B|nr:putative E3 ubiquitin-protein ligase UBR7 [Bombina bombina]
MAANEQGEKRSLDDSAGDEEPVLSLLDVLEEDDALQDEACAVLGGSDAEKCSYPEGYVKRQALYACNTCTPNKEEPAGICLACTYKCHEGHDLFELYTKRNFRCDCGNGKFKQMECKLFPEKEKCNAANKYNTNFFGLYCTCKRPYPDPEDEVPDEMIQCVVCEDWFHGRHLGAVPPEDADYQEMVCQVCMNRCSFLWTYAAQLAVPTVTKITPAEVEQEDLKVDDCPEQNVKVENGLNIKAEDIKEEDMADQHNGPSTSTKSEEKCTNGELSHPVKTESKPVATCKLEENKIHQGYRTDTAVYWLGNWRSKLCTCDTCMKMYAELEVVFLLEESDTVLAYESKGKNEASEGRDPLMTALSNMNRVQQVELICEYNDLKTELRDYLKTFAEEGKVVQTEDIQRFFEQQQSRKRRRMDGMQYYCS